MNFFVLDVFGLCPIQMDEPGPSCCSSGHVLLVALAFFCLFLFGIVTGGIQGMESSCLTDNNSRDSIHYSATLNAVGCSTGRLVRF